MEKQRPHKDGIATGFEHSSKPGSFMSQQSYLTKKSSGGFVRTTVLIALALLVLAGGAYALKVRSDRQTNKIAVQPSDNYAVQDIPLSDLINSDSIGLNTLQSLSINGQLRANNSLVIAPTDRPTQGTIGQIYYDKSGNVLAYYDGTKFVDLAGTDEVAQLRQELGVVRSSLSQVAAAPSLPEGIATQSGDNTFTGVNSFTGSLSATTLALSGAASLQGSLSVNGPTNLSSVTAASLNVSGASTLGPTTISSLVLSSPLSVSSGGTGVSSFTTNGILIGQGSGSLTTVNAAGSGLCLISTAGAPSFQACPGGGGSVVDSLNGLTGPLTLANASGVGSTVTIDNASTAAKGIASFNATNFSVSSGAVNTIQNIAVTSTPTFAGLSLSGNLNVGTNSIVTSGATISSVELEVLDGGISEGEVTGVITDVTAGNGLTGGSASGNATLDIASANGGIAVNADNIALVLQPTGDALSATTSSGSGLEILTSGLSLLQGCGDGQILKWSEVSDTWGCAADAGGSGVGDDVAVNGLNADGGNFINTVASGSTAGVTWNLNTTPSPDEISLTVSNASATEAGVVTTGIQSFAGDKTYNNAVTVTGLFTANGGVTIEPGDTFTLNGDALTDLSGTGLVVAGGVLQASLGVAIDSSEITDLTITGADIANDTITDTQLAFDTGQHLTVTSTPTFAGVTLNGNLSLGSNSIVTGGATISSAELDVLDGGITELEVSGVITDVTAGSGLTGGAASGNATLNIASANGGIVVNADDIALMLQPSGDALSTTTSSGSGLEILSSGLSLLQGCGDGQVLKWNETTDTWGCADDAGGSGLGDDISVNGLAATNANFIDTAASGSVAGIAWALNTTPSPDDISITVSNASATEAGVVTTGVQSFAGDKTFNNAATITGLFTANGGVTIEAGDTLTFNGDAFTDLTGTGLLISGGFLQTTLGVAIDSSEITDLTITGADIADDTIALGTKTTGDYVAGNTGGTGIAVTGSTGEGWSPTISLDYSADLTTNSLGVNQSSFAATGILFEGSTADAFETLFTLVDPTADNTITIPNASGTICLTTGNCAGAGGGVTTSGGSTNRLAKFTGSQAINDSTITDDGTNVTTTVDMIIQGGDVTLGTNAQLGSFILNDGNGQTTTLQAGDSAGNLTFILPTAVGNQYQCLKYDTAGQLIWDDCDGGSGGGGGVTTLNGLSGGVTIQGNSQIGVNPSSPNIDISINADSIGDAQLAFNTGQHLTVTSTPTFASLIVTGDTTANRPAGTEGQIFYDTDTDKLLVFSGGKWQADRTSVSKTVAPSNAPQHIKDSADYIADGTGDQVEINNALTTAAGGRVYLFEGTFTTTDTISIPNNTTLAGSGKGTLIQFGNLAGVSKNMITNTTTGGTGTGVTIRDLKLDGDKTTNSTGTVTGIYFDGTGSASTNLPGATITDITVQNFRTNGIHLAGTPGTANNNITDNVIQANGSYGIYTNNANHDIITGNTITDNTLNGIYLTATGREVVSSNFIGSNGNYGIRIDAGSNNTISGNVLRSNTGSTSTSSIYITGGAGTEAHLITGNNITDTAGTGYAIDLSDAAVDSVYLSNNTYSGTGASSINDASGGDTVYGGQVNGSGNYLLQPSGTIELLKNTNITGNLGIGSNSIITSGATISSVELDVLDGGITEGEVTGVITDVTAGNGLSGGAASGNATLDITSANGAIVVNADDIALTLQPSANGLSGTVSSGSGLEILAGGLSLLQGCADGEVLKWNETTDTWGCAPDAGGSGLGDDITVNGSGATNANFIDTVASGSAAGIAWVLNTTPSPDEISLTVSNASATVAGVVTTGTQTFAGDKTFNNAVTIAGLLTASANISIGSNSIITSGATISSAELDVLDNGVDENEVTGVITDVTAGSGLTGGAASGNASVNVASANGGIVVGADSIALTLQPAGDALSATTSSGSGLEVLSGGLALLQGCGDAQVLKWNETSDTWGCSDDAGGAGLGDDISVNGASATNANFINTTASGTTAGVTWSLNTTPSPDEISLTVSNASATVAGVVTTGTQTFAGDKTFNNALTIQGNTVLGSDVADTLSVNAVSTFNENITVSGGKSLTLTGSGTRPGSPSEGTLYFDTTTKRLLIYSNGKWQADRVDAVIVAASNSSQADKDAADYVADGNTVAAADGDQVQINSALTAGSGKKVVLLAGTYVADATILIPNNTTLSGVGAGTLVELADLDASDNLVENSDTSTGTGIVIRDMKLDGRKDLNTAGTQRGISFTAMGGGTGSGARLGGQINNVTVTSFRSENVYLFNSSHNTITNVTVLASSSDGLQIGTSSAYNVVTGSKFQGNSGNGFLANGGSGNNTITGNNAQGNSNGFHLANSSNNSISGNTSSGNTSYGYQVGASATSNTYTSNTAQGNTSGGFNISGTGNTLSGNTSNGGTIGFNVNANNNTVSSNTVQGATQAILVSADYVNVIGNTVNSSSTYGIYLTSANNSNVNSNRIYDTGGSTANNGIYIVSSDNNSFADNTITDGTGTTNCSTTCYAINISNSLSDATYLADNLLGNGTINDSGTGTIYGGQVNSSGNFVLQPAGTIELMKDTNVTGALNVTGNGDFNGSLTVGSANQFVISSTGVVTSGTWQGTAVADTYVADDLTINSAGTVDWQALSNYPAACAANSAITQLGDSVTCQAFATSSGSGSYIQNQFAGAQSSSDFWISGTGRADVALVTPALRAAADSTTAIQIQNAAGSTSILTADTTNARIGIGATPSYKLHVAETVTANSGSSITSYVATTASPSSAPGAATTYTGSYSITSSASANLNANVILYGSFGVAQNAGTASLGAAVGATALAQNAAGGSITNGIALQGRVSNTGAGSITNGIGLQIVSPEVTAGSITNAYGIMIQDQDVSGVGTGYGILQSGVNDINYFAGSLAIGTGVAPTSALDVAGTGKFSTSVLTPTLDTASAVALDVGTTNATQINLNKHVIVAPSQVILLQGGNTASRQGTAQEGMVYYDTDTKKLIVYSNGKWQADRSDAVLVAASDSTQAEKDAADFVADGNTGAAADGDQVEINQALVAAAGKKVVLFAGTYVVDDSVSIPNNTTLAGTGADTLVTIPNSLGAGIFVITNTDTTTGTGVVIRDLRVDGNKSNQGAFSMTGVFMSSVGGGSGASARRGGKIVNVQSNNFTSDGIYLNGGAHTIISDSSTQGNDSAGFYLGTSNYVKLTGNSANGNTVYGFRIAASGSTLEGNVAEGNAQGFYLEGAAGNTLTGNTAQSNTNRGFALVSSSNDNTLTGNTASSNISTNFYLNASSTNVLTGNTSTGGTSGFSLNASSNGNTLTGNTATIAGTGFSLTSSSRNTLTGNTAQSNTSAGMSFNSSSTNTISGNKLHDNGNTTANNAIILASSSSNLITGNSIGDTSATTTNYAIDVTSAASSANYISGNTLGTGTINDAGTGTIYGGQVNSSGDYLLQPSGTIELLKNTNVTGTLTATQLASTVATGTAPITVNSTTLVANLNSDLLDGQSGSFYQDAGNINAGTLAVNRGGTGAGTFTQYGILFGNGTGAFGVTAAGTTGQCLLATTSAAPTWGTCTPTNLQGTYDASSPATINLTDNKNFTINAADTATDSSIVFNLQCSTCSASGGRFAIQDAGVDIFTINPNGDIIIGTASNNVTFVASSGYKPTASGTARNSKKIRLHAEYQSVVLTPDGSNNLGTMTSGYDNGSSARMSYYNWTTTQGSNQDYDIVVQVPLPADFSAWDGANPLSITTRTSDTTNGTITLEARDSADAQICNFVSVTPGSTNTWTANNTACTLSTGTYTAGDYITLRIKLQAPNAGNTRVGNITLNYLSKF